MVFQNNLLAGASGASGTEFDTTLIGNSVWFDSGDYLSQDSAAADSSRKEAIFSTWIQRTSFGAQGIIMSVNGSSATDYLILDFQSDDTLRLLAYDVTTLVTTQVFRDVGWYHILLTIDTSQNSNASQKIFVNGEEVASFSTRNNFGSSADIAWGRNATHLVNSSPTSLGQNQMIGYMAQTALITDKSFQQSDYSISDFLDTFTFGTNGSQFIPKKNSDIATIVGTGGNNSFFLNYETSDDLGNDGSSKNNDFTANSMGGANQSIHTPSNVYPKISNLGIPSNDTSASYSMSRGSNRMTYSGGNQVAKGLVSDKVIESDDPKIYWEFYVEAGSVSGNGGRLGNGIVVPQFDNSGGFYDSGGESAYFQRGTLYDNGSSAVSSFTTAQAGGVQNFAFEPSTGKVWIGVNGTWRNGSATDSTTLNIDNHDDQLTVQDYIFIIGLQRSGDIGVINFGDNPTFSGNETAGTNADENGHGLFAYAVPSGFLAPCSANLTGPENQGVDYFNAVKYAGNGTVIGSGGKSVTGVGFKPDWVWIKNRDAGDDHALYDIARGVTKQWESNTNTTASTESEGLTTFGSDGFTVGSLDQVNTNTENFISWNWLGSNSTSTTSPAGTIASTSSVSSPGHFSVGTYTGTGDDNATVGHGLGGIPEMIIVRNLSRSTFGLVWHTDGGGVTHTADFAVSATFSANNEKFGGSDETAPTASVFKIGDHNEINADGESLVFYAFRSVAGVCKIGSYLGNGSGSGTANGPFISCGFKPRWIMFKWAGGGSLSGEGWVIKDTIRQTINPNDDADIYASSSGAEAAGATHGADILADGFKIRGGGGAVNKSGATYIYLAMADIGGNGTLPPTYGR